jgi:hypothetical protein
MDIKEVDCQSTPFGSMYPKLLWPGPGGDMEPVTVEMKKAICFITNGFQSRFLIFRGLNSPLGAGG